VTGSEWTVATATRLWRGKLAVQVNPPNPGNDIVMKDQRQCDWRMRFHRGVGYKFLISSNTVFAPARRLRQGVFGGEMADKDLRCTESGKKKPPRKQVQKTCKLQLKAKRNSTTVVVKTPLASKNRMSRALQHGRWYGPPDSTEYSVGEGFPRRMPGTLQCLKDISNRVRA